MKKIFYCDNCNVSVAKFCSMSLQEVECPECASLIKPRLPNVLAPRVNERSDAMFKVHLHNDHEDMILERTEDHYWKNEVPRLIRQYGEEEALRKGWMYKDEKGLLKIQNKPPRKR